VKTNSKVSSKVRFSKVFNEFKGKVRNQRLISENEFKRYFTFIILLHSFWTAKSGPGRLVAACSAPKGHATLSAGSKFCIGDISMATTHVNLSTAFIQYRRSRGCTSRKYQFSSLRYDSTGNQSKLTNFSGSCSNPYLPGRLKYKYILVQNVIETEHA